MNIYIGTSGFNYADWKGKFYPQDLSQKNWLAFYAQRFSTLEINATFYHSFSKDVYAHWYKQTPSYFLFSLKGPRRITHHKRLKDISEPQQIFFDEITPLQEKLAVILWQFPHNFKKNEETQERLENFIQTLSKQTRHVVELRDTSWFDKAIFKLLQTYNIGLVINDSSIFPSKEIVTTDFTYIRFHGPQKLYSSSYSQQELAIWAGKIQTFAKQISVYCYFNNDVAAYAITNAQALQNYLEK